MSINSYNLKKIYIQINLVVNTLVIIEEQNLLRIHIGFYCTTVVL